MFFNVWVIIWPNQKKASVLCKLKQTKKRKQAGLQCFFEDKYTALDPDALCDGSGSEPPLVNNLFSEKGVIRPFFFGV